MISRSSQSAGQFRRSCFATALSAALLVWSLQETSSHGAEATGFRSKARPFIKQNITSEATRTIVADRARGGWGIVVEDAGGFDADSAHLKVRARLINVSGATNEFVGSESDHPFEFFLQRPDGVTEFADLPAIECVGFRTEICSVQPGHEAVFVLNLQLLGRDYDSGDYFLTAVALVPDGQKLKGAEIRSETILIKLPADKAPGLNFARAKSKPVISISTGLPFDPVVKGYHETHGLPESTKEQARAMGISIPGEQKVRSSRNPLPATPGTPPQASLNRIENDSPPQSAAPLGFSPSSGIAILAALVLIAVIILWRASRRA